MGAALKKATLKVESQDIVTVYQLYLLFVDL